MKKDSVSTSTAENDKAISETPAPAEASNINQERPSIPAHMMRRRRKRRSSKLLVTKKRRRGVSVSSDGLGCSIIADAATLAGEETPTRPLPEKAPSRDEPRGVSILSPSSPTKRPSALNTAQSSQSTFKSAALSPQSGTDSPRSKPPRKASLRRSSKATPVDAHAPRMAFDALTKSSSASERRTPSQLRRTQSRGALTTVTFGRTSSTTLLPAIPTSPRPSAGYFTAHGCSGAHATTWQYGGLSVQLPRHAAQTREPSTADTGTLVGGLRRVGLQICALMSLGVLTFHWLAMPLLAPSVDHWCSKPREAGNMSDARWRSAAIPVRSDGRISQCTMYSSLAPISMNESVDAVPAATRYERNCTAWDYDLAPGIKTMTNEWNVVCDRRKQLLVAVVYNNFGGLVAMPFVGQMADRLGRRTVEAGSLMLSILAAAATVSTTDFANFVVARMLLTGSLAAVALAMIVAVFEASYSQRQRQLTVCFAHLVVSLAALLPRLLSAIMTFDRRAVCLAVLLCAFAMFVMVLGGVEESPRWQRAVFEGATSADSRAQTSKTAVNRFTRGVSSLLLRKYSKVMDKVRCRKQPAVSSVGLLFDQALRTRTLVLAFTLFALLNSLPAHANEDVLSMERLNDVARPMLRVCSIVAADQLLRECSRREALLLALPCVCLLVCAEAVAEATAAQSTLPLIR
ncbi:hypothetical protein HPB51_002949 [Rhipicephalus microplus]|uniref:Uncharacterized protein n=1 Tax=Rhipicephalus microplus TaxID=6941 RepID=A0A9J6DS60_RHIMP|nr:hypothetical protein HPB51_002949 [Rhipicephalus microplus]